MQEIAEYISSELKNRNIKTKISKSSKSDSVYVMCKNMPEIRVSDHIGGHVRKYIYNVIVGDKSMMAHTTTIMIRGHVPIFYYSSEDVDKLINSYEVLYKKRNLI